MSRTQSMLCASVFALGAILCSAELSRADDPAYSTVSGIARFVRRTALTPQVCNGDVCAKPQPYWSLVLGAGGTRYELNQPFEIGREDSPDSIELGSVVIRPGTRVQVDAHVDVINRSYSILSDVRNVRVAPELGDESYAGTPFFGWTCRSVAEPRQIYVDVEQVARGARYAMRVVTATGGDEPGFTTLVAFDQVELAMTPALIGFSGQAEGIRVELKIDQSEGRAGPLDSVLELTGDSAPQGFDLPAHLPLARTVQMVCDRTR